MFRVIGNKIYLTRGDSAFLDIQVKNPDGTDYILAAGDQLLMTVKDSTSSETTRFQHTIVDGTVEILPQDTENLPYGDYVYDCQLRTYSGVVQTFIPPSLFRVMEEVTF